MTTPRPLDFMVLRYGEIFLKKARKRFFVDSLVRAIRASVGSELLGTIKISRPYGRIEIEPRGEGGFVELDTLLERIGRVFGLVWIDVGVRTERSMDELRDVGLELVSRALEARGDLPAPTFRVDTTRRDKRFPHRSIEVNIALAEHILAKHLMPVKLVGPELSLRVEIQEDYVFSSVMRIKGLGGLPVGSNGRALVLLSGGIDSPLAAWLTMKRGVAVDAIYFHSFPLVSDGALEKVKRLAAILARYQHDLRLFVAPFAEVQKATVDKAQRKNLVILYRRFMVRIAEALAAREGHPVLITGESIGQVASQTLGNLVCVQSVAERPILRPLVTYDKVETIALARDIGTYDVSIEPFDDCCSLFVPKHPELSCPIHVAEREESKLEVEALVAASVEGTKEVVF